MVNNLFGYIKSGEFSFKKVMLLHGQAKCIEFLTIKKFLEFSNFQL